MDNSTSQSNLNVTADQTPQTIDKPTNTPSPWQIPAAQTTVTVENAENTSVAPATVIPTTEPASPWQTSTTPLQDVPRVASPWQTTSIQEVKNETVVAEPSFPTAFPTISTPTTEPEAPLMPKKKGIPPVVTGVLALFFVVGVAGGMFMLSRGVNTSASIAPNAPASEPKAFDPSEESGTDIITPMANEDTVPTETTIPTDAFDPNGSIDCANEPDTAPYGNRCVATVVSDTGEVTWAPGAIEALQ